MLYWLVVVILLVAAVVIGTVLMLPDVISTPLAKRKGKKSHVQRACCYWHGSFGRMQHASAQSFQHFNPQTPLVVLVDTESRHTTVDNPWLRGFTVELIETPNFHELWKRADWVRYQQLEQYGGWWFDLDVLFMQSIYPLSQISPSDKPWTYPWGNLPNKLNNAVMYAPRPHMAPFRSLVQIKDPPIAKDCLQSHDFRVWPLLYFDPAWSDDSPFTCSDFFRHRGRTAYPKKFFTCYGFHWHNRWDAEIHPESWFTIWERRIHS